MMEATPHGFRNFISIVGSRSLSLFLLNILYREIQKKINYHDHHGSVGSARLNITVVKETFLSPLTSNKRDDCLILQYLN
jgi:hypothetical protein